jgi:uncharacterized protein YrrD
MDDLGAPIAYLALERGAPVFDSSGDRIGVVERVLGDPTADIFEGLELGTGPLHTHRMLADVDQIAGIHERGVRLSVGREALAEAR